MAKYRIRTRGMVGRSDRSRPLDQSIGPDGRGQFFAPARGYAVYAPK